MAKRSKKKRARSREIPATVADTDIVAASPSSWLQRDWLSGLILFLAVILAYSPVWWAGYIWDDDQVVTANPVIVGPLGLNEIWTTSAADICPLTMTTFWVEHALWGLAPLPYHLANVFLHGAGAIVLWRVLRSLQAPGAWLGAALWALHPVEVESVAWITEMKNTESGLFYLLSILFFVRWLRGRDLDERTGSGWNYGLTLLFAALAMASKSSTVILPIVLCLCAWWTEGRWHGRNLARVGPIFLMGAVASAVSMWTQKLQIATFADQQWVLTWPQRLIAAGDAVWFYLGKLLWPYPLTTIYPRWEIDAGQWVSYLPLMATIIVLFILWLKRGSWSRPWFFVFGYFMAALLPVLGLVDNTIFRYSLVFDHFQYLASMGPLALAGAGMARWSNLVIPRRPRLQSALSGGLLLTLGILSWQRAWVYESKETLWTDTLAKNQNCPVGHYNLGLAIFQDGQVDEAIDQYQKALEINPHYADAENNLGLALERKGLENEAIVHYQRALEIDPGLTAAHNNLGMALFQTGRVDEAIEQYGNALKSDPDFAQAHSNLGAALARKGQEDEAIEQYQKALEINPDFLEAHYNLGSALLQKGQLDEAIDQYQKALELNPNIAQIHASLGKALLEKRDATDAIVQFKQALQLKPDFTDAQENLAKAQDLLRQQSAEGAKMR